MLGEIAATVGEALLLPREVGGEQSSLLDDSDVLDEFSDLSLTALVGADSGLASNDDTAGELRDMALERKSA